MKNKFKNNFGFTLIEVMITVAISGVIALFAMMQLKNSQVAVNTSMIASETSYLKNLVLSNMTNSTACNNTFKNQPITLTGSVILIDKTGTPFLKTNDVITDISKDNQKKLFTITAISSFPTPRTDNGLTITVEYDINSNLEKISKKTKNSFNVDVFIKKLNATTVANCFFDTSGMIRKAVMASCQGNGATYDGSVVPYGACNHVITVNGVTLLPSTPSSGLCPAGQFLDSVTNSVDNKTVFTCKTFTSSGTQCAPDEVMSEIKSDGAPTGDGYPVCVKLNTLFPATPGQPINVLAVTGPGAYVLSDMDCSMFPNTVLQRINPKRCIPKVINKQCPPNQYVQSVDNNGNFSCAYFTKKTAGACPGGTYLTSVNADGSVPAGACQPLTLPANCGGGVLAAVDSNGNAARCN